MLYREYWISKRYNSALGKKHAPPSPPLLHKKREMKSKTFHYLLETDSLRNFIFPPNSNFYSFHVKYYNTSYQYEQIDFFLMEILRLCLRNLKNVHT